MSEIKLIALDLDGTLLDDQKRLSYQNEEVLKECIRRGIYIVPCTGRIWKGIPDFIKDIEGIRYAITVNGALIFDRESDTALSKCYLSNDLAMEMLHFARNYHVMYDAYIDGQGISENRFIENMSDYGIVPTVQRMLQDTRIVVPDILDYVKQSGIPAEKVNYFFDDMKLRETVRQKLRERGDVVVSSSLSNNLEINALGATKGEGILFLARHLGLKPEETMGIGDGDNDMTMMQMAGIGVAMGNAEASVKAAANYVTLTNQEDGVADAIRKLVLNRQQ
ncbi:MAG: Cof-type HAD-IIB family hydrolase [Lachnospiraceae bacterium]